ncbi:MAG: tRNA (adenosine(37)-N6)-threonylcarbamoyltransferase complex ATPase subunit type 1 TsaE [candidate division WOR-3 bacterium]|jgi:tRNA threonylcarbamoyladenosine biosynthesis protein TsaE|nr:tRNA (adenosine(37)-N6)-threonylcarbamoyltransferase complex ATPase subunit type 1 TsaE [candidate division WOR-3 bacterium]MCR4422929.1 tRNA (adenosine(37)-N6)-threonylcarbamoyltransferase complex ATPase subunit type 1 TsaE [candidate division WOR-3 bacterium]MDH7518268.1 tRNA (adenosine(37)-N6)-threonylcarbamoyltransferase complex ATPase subunit type 1 TsaE [bacterium]
MQPIVYETTDADATITLGERLASFLKPGAVVAFYGDLGAGKTTMIKGFARGLGVKEVVKSPSFVIITEYQGRLPVYHIDLYRIRSIDELLETGFDSYLGAEGVCLIEWAERAEKLLPKNTIRIKLTLIDQRRRIEITGLDRGLTEELK